MAWPTDPLQPEAELHLGALGWVDVSADVRLSSASSGGGIHLRHGRSSGANQGEPSSCSLTFANPDGRYSLRNPRSPWFGLLVRNTPLRLSVPVLNDTFSRTVVGGLGSADTGEVWETGDPGSFGVASGQLTITHDVANTLRFAHLVGDLTDVEQVSTFSIPAVALGASVVVGHMARYTPGGDYYWLRLEFDRLGEVTTKIAKRVGGAYTDLAVYSAIPELTYTAGQKYRLRSVCVGSALATKVWADGTPEPAEWTLVANDRSIPAGARVGLNTWVVAGNTNSPKQVRVDDYRVRDPRFFGELSVSPPRSDLSENDQWVAAQAYGIQRRLGQGTSPVRSPLRRMLLSLSPAGYLPLEDGETATQPSSAVGNSIVGIGSAVNFGVDGGLPGAQSVAQFQGTSGLLRTPVAGSSSLWSALVLLRMPTAPVGASPTTYLRIHMAGGSVATWEFGTASNYFRFAALDRDGVVLDEYTPGHGDTPPTNWLAMSWRMQQNGGNIQWGPVFHTVGDDLFYGGYTLRSFAGTVGRITAVELVGGAYSPDPMWSHLFVSTQALPINSTYFRRIAMGYAGETAGERMARVCGEEGVPITFAGDFTETSRMGPQPSATLMDIVRQCEEVDGGVLFDARWRLGLHYRTRVSMYNQTPLPVSYGLGYVSPPFQPVDDDNGVANDLTLTRSGGGQVRVVDESSSMSVLPPPLGIGRYESSATLNVDTEADLANQAGWRLHLGTADEQRYDSLRVDFSARSWVADRPLAVRARALAPGDLARVDDMPLWLPPDPPLLLLRGYTEFLDAFDWSITWAGDPGGAWTVAVLDGGQRYAATGSKLALPLSSDGTSFTLSSALGNGPWTTDPADFPLDVRVGGERVRLSGITGTTLVQVATIAPGSRGLNGVQRAWPVETLVDVWDPAIISL